MRSIAYCIREFSASPQDLKQEMSQNDRNFLRWILDRYQPATILEVGVAAGGTSLFILKSCGGRLFSIDKSEAYYRDPARKTGFVALEGCDAEELGRWTLAVGAAPVDCLDTLLEGRKVDLCILDTLHILPGELLQFLVLYQYIKAGGVLVLHDLNLNMIAPDRCSRACATKLLFCILGSKQKMLPDICTPNIGALVIDDLTRLSIPSVFFALSASWAYYPADEIESYAQFFRSHYSPWEIRCFENCLAAQEKLTGYKK